MKMQDISFNVLRRDGHVVPFDASKIRAAIVNAFLKDGAGNFRSPGRSELSSSERERVDRICDAAVSAVTRRRDPGAAIGIEDIQDQVELALMRSGEHDVARDYVLFRERRAEARRAQAVPAPIEPFVNVNGERQPARLLAQALVSQAAEGLDGVDIESVVTQALRDSYDGMPLLKLDEAVQLAARAMIEKDPIFDRLTTRLLLNTIRQEVIGIKTSNGEMAIAYPHHLVEMVELGVAIGRLSPELASYDLEKLGRALRPERDFQFRYMGLKTLYDRYFLHDEGRRIELPQSFFMRVAMGLALGEVDRDDRAIEFYELLSSFRFMSSTPTLFNSGTLIPQLSSCYLTTVADNLDGIYESIKENALLQKFAGGLGNDWTPVRALGSWIRGTNGKSQGVIPFLKVVNDTAVAVNQGGKRKGAVCAYLEAWHLDVEEFLELRKNTGDDRRRTHDMDTAIWVPDLFMQRLEAGEDWTLFSPVDVPDLHDLHGKAFAEAYGRYEALATAGKIKHHKRVKAEMLWRKMLSMLFETGHPWICFKDPCNIRSPQQHVGVVHSSNLCTEITLNTNADEIAVCNLGSVNLAVHMQEGATSALDLELLERTVSTAMRMLDNVIDLNHYAVWKAADSNRRHRPVGLGVMGLQDCLYRVGLPFGSTEAVSFGSRALEAVSYFAYSASCRLAEERGSYETFKGSLWDRGLLPPDSLHMLEQERGSAVDIGQLTSQMDWDGLRGRISLFGMRNSNCMAIAPTATIANIVGVHPSIEPAFKNVYAKSNMSGDFTFVNESLVQELKALGIWDDVMLADLKYFEGSLQEIDRVPEAVKRLFATAFEIDPIWLVKAAALRQVWIDQSQSLNLFFAKPSGKTIDQIYRQAWASGLKTTYYLRSMGATSAEKSTARIGDLNAVSAAPSAAACSLDNPGCESCQ